MSIFDVLRPLVVAAVERGGQAAGNTVGREGAEALPSADRSEFAFMQLEYQQVKAEMLASITAQHTTMQYALAAAGAMFAGLIAVWGQVSVRISILALGPLLLGFLWFTWLGELIRMSRAAHFLMLREREIKTAIADMQGQESRWMESTWEEWVRGGNSWKRVLQLKLTYALNSCALFGMGAISVILSNWFAYRTSVDVEVRVMSSVCGVVVLILAILGLVHLRENPVLRRGSDDL